MLHDKDFEYYEKIAHWSFDEYDCHTESLTDWDLYEILKSVATPDSHVLRRETACEFPRLRGDRRH